MGSDVVVGKLAESAKLLGERFSRLHWLNIGPRLTLCFLLIVVAMLVGNSVLLWQFHRVRTQAERLGGVDQELIAVLQAHTNLMSLYERLDVLTHLKDAALVTREVETLRNEQIEDSLRIRSTLSHLPPEVRIDPTLLPSVAAIQDALPAQLEPIADLAKAKDWDGVRLRLANEVRPLELRSAALVESIDREVGEERAQAIQNIAQAQRRILLIVPLTAVVTLLFAAFLGVTITRSITQPLGRLMEGSTALARGDFSHRVHAEGKDEIARLGAVFNDMIVRLQELYRELQRRENYLSEAQRLSHTGSFGWHVASGEIYWSSETFRIFELEPAPKINIDEVTRRIHPDDRLAVQQHFERVSRERTALDMEHRLLMPDGSIKYLHVVGHPSGNEGDSLEFIGAVTDITERRQAEKALRRSERYLAEAQRLTRSGSWAWSVRSHDVFWSKEMFRIFGYDPDKTKPSLSLFYERVHPGDRPAVEERATVESTRKGIEDSEGDYRIVLADGKTKHLHSISHPVADESGEITEVVGTTMDVTEQHQARMALETAFEQIKALKDQLHEENIALREEIDRSSMFEEIVGESSALQMVLSHVVKVAPTDSTVLITGETGTGKELIARAIHKRSARAARAFVSVSCAAIPPSLIASELFGHEKGAFTGAVQRHLGRFELAEGGTVFLDEIGELPLDTQIALLRVLQEREFERVGSPKTIRANVRVIAATNRDLLACVGAGTFRRDLYYRLNVFPIEMPPLRRRAEDIPLLVEYFIDRYARKAGKRIRGISRATVDKLTSYDWPGNIRELQNVIERSVIVCESENLTVDESWLSRNLPESDQTMPHLFRMPPSEEKKTIEAALADTRGRVSGPSGAATKLGIPASTLESKIRALNIDKNRFKVV
jgi:PAS domain S-box-containing protein